MIKRIKKIEDIGIQQIYSTNTKNGNYISASGMINKNCLIDTEYSGEVHINLHNVSNKEQKVCAGDKIVQFMLMPIRYDIPEEVSNEEYESITSVFERGEKGFGSSGSK